MTTSSVNSSSGPAIDSGSLSYLGVDASGRDRRLYVTSGGALGTSVKDDVVTISVSAQDYAALMAAANAQSTDIPAGDGQGFEVTPEVLDAIRAKYIATPDWNPGLAFAQSLDAALGEISRFTNSQLFPSTARYMNSVKGFCDAILQAARESARLRSQASQKAVEVSIEIAESKKREEKELIAQTGAQGASVGVSAFGGAAGAYGALKTAKGRDIELRERAAEANFDPVDANDHYVPNFEELGDAEAFKRAGEVSANVAQSVNNVAMTQNSLAGSAASVGVKAEEAEQALLQGEGQQLQTAKDSADSQVRADESALASANSGIAQVGNAEKAPGG